MEDHLTGDSFLQRIFTLSLQDWTPDVAELVRIPVALTPMPEGYRNDEGGVGS